MGDGERMLQEQRMIRKRRVRAGKYKACMLLMAVGMMLPECRMFCKADGNQKRTEETNQMGIAEAKPDAATKLSILFSRDDMTWSLVMDDLCNEFETQNPDIDLELMDPGSGKYEENLKAREAMDEFPDLFELQNVAEYAEAGMLGEIPESVCHLLEEPTYMDGSVYSVPIYTTTYGMIYNQVLFDRYQLQIPKTYKEFQSICETLEQNGVVPLAIDSMDSNIYWFDFFYHKDVLAAGEEEGLNFLSEEYLNMLEDYQELINHRYVLKDSMYMNEIQIINCLFSSNVAMYYTTPEFIAKLILQDSECTSAEKIYVKTPENEEREVQLGWFFIPDDEGNSVAAKEIGSRFSISAECAADSRRKEAAERFFTFLFQAENYREILKSMYGFQTTTRRVLYPSPGIQQRLIIDYRYSKKAEPFMAQKHVGAEFKNELSKALYLLAGNTMSVEEAAEYLSEKWKEAL